MGIPTLITTATASNAASIDITSGIDSTYDEYMFVLTDIGPATNDVLWTWNMSTDSGSNYNVTKTTTYFRATHNEADTAGSTNLAYSTSDDIAQGTGFQTLAEGVGSDADESSAGILHLFSPASTTYVKHFYSRVSNTKHSPDAQDIFVAGYGNTTSAVDAVQFKMSSGNFDGVIQMYGIS